MTNTLPKPYKTGLTMHEGYGWMEMMQRLHKFKVRPEFGDWPYHVIMTKQTGSTFYVSEFTEGDFKIWRLKAADYKNLMAVFPEAQ